VEIMSVVVMKAESNCLLMVNRGFTYKKGKGTGSKGLDQENNGPLKRG